MLPTSSIVYDLRTKNLSSVAPIPEQIGTTTMHVPEVPGGTYQKLLEWKLGEMSQINVFRNRMYLQWKKMDQNLMFFSASGTKNREKTLPIFSAGNLWYGFLGASQKCIVVVLSCSGMGATNSNSKGPAKAPWLDTGCIAQISILFYPGIKIFSLRIWCKTGQYSQ